MRLSEAIREGSRRTTKCVGISDYGPDGDHPIRTCAIGAALLSIGKLNTYTTTFQALGFFPLLRKKMKDGEAPDAYKGSPNGDVATLANVIIWLNDAEGWTREAIAEWVETIENKIEAEVPAEVVGEPVKVS